MPLNTTQDTLFARKSLDFEKKLILKKIGQMSNLPTPGASIMRVMLLLRDEDVSMKELIKSIQQNQSLVARILKLINSGYYGLRKTIDSVERAVNLLGILKVKQLVYSASIMHMFSEDEQGEWNHAYTSSVLMSDIMEEHEIPAASNLPLTVLMHDIGKVILRRFSPKKFHMSTEMARREKLPSSVAEDRVIHINHAEAGGWLLERWQMTEDIYIPVAWHHTSSGLPPEDFYVETALIQFVNWVDCTAREVPCMRPSLELMEAAGFDEIDYDYWVSYQKKVIANVEGGGDMLADEDDEKPRPVSPTDTAPIIESGDISPATKSTDTEKISRSRAEPGHAEFSVRAESIGEKEVKTSTRKIDRKGVLSKNSIDEETQEINLAMKNNRERRGFWGKLLDAVLTVFKD
jgi:HD-like signal output (HDOD) protein